MGGMLGALLLLCGVDYSGAGYNSCLSNTEKCYQSNEKELSIIKPGKELTKSQKLAFYKCYTAGADEKKKDTVILKR